MNKNLWITLISLQLTFGFNFAQAQTASSSAFLEYKESQGPADYIIKRYPNQKLMPARLVSGVSRPGFYQIPENTSLLSLVSYSGGFTQNADLEEIVIWRQASKQSFEINMKDHITDPNGVDPVVMPNDIIYIKEKPRIEDTVTLVAVISTSIAAILGAIAVHDRATNYKP